MFLNKFVGININDKNVLSCCKVKDKDLKKGVTIIVKDSKSTYFARVVKEELNNTINLAEYDFVRISSKKDYQIFKNNEKLASKALIKCQELADKLNLGMKVLSCDYTFNQNQLLFSYTADSRIDFRDLVKELALIYKTRIELRQVGVRDKASIVGGCGQCGRGLCCAKFLNDLDSVSINMAKNQNIALNPNKINGVCGRLLCCLKYEDDTYTECRRNLPNLGSTIEIKEGKGKVVAIDLLKQTYKVDIPDVGVIECDLKNESN